MPFITSSTSFTPADPARNSPSYMDSGGVWNGSAEVTNTTGDTFSITLRNTATGVPNPLVNDVAFDIALTLNVPSGFRLPVSPLTVTTSASGGDPGAGNCVAPGGSSITATQPGGVGTPITFNFPANTNLPAQGAGTSPCSYVLSFGLTTSDTAPFVAAGTHTLNYSFSYNEIDGDPASQETVNAGQNIAVRRGDVIVTKTAVPNPADSEGGYADGETAEWIVSVFNNGNGGTFAVQLTDTPNVNFDIATLQLTPPASPPGTPFPVPQGANQYTLNYLRPGAAEQVDITVQAQVMVPSTAGSCPDLRNDVSVIDRLQNTSSAFASVVLDLQDPLLDYTPPNFTIDFGTPETVFFNVGNTGSGEARNVRLAVSGLSGVTISAVSAEWLYDEPSSTFIHVGPDGALGGGDDRIAASGSSLLQFNATMNTCGGPTGGFLTWTPQYENICGLDFTPPIRNSTYSVNNFPDLAVDKNVSPVATNFGAPAFYTIDLIGNNVGSLETVAGADNDWQVNDMLPSGVSNGVISTVPPGTVITILTALGDTDVYTSGPVPVTAGDRIVWEGDREDLDPIQPSIRVDFTVTNTCTQTPPFNFTNIANLQYPSCGINISDAAPLVVNDSPIDSIFQVFDLAAGQSPPFETGRPDTDLTPTSEPNEGEHITFRANYPFQSGYAGQWDNSSFRAEMGTGSGGLAEPPLQLAFADANNNGVLDVGEDTGVTVQVINSDNPALSMPQRRLPLSAAAIAGVGTVVINPNGSITIPDLDFIAAEVGSPSMSNMELIIEYTVTAPEGSLAPDLQPLDDDNVGAFEERVTISVAGDPNSCAGNNDFIQGIGVALARADVSAFGAIDAVNDAGACGVTTATLNLFGPSLASALNADNIRIRLQSTDYDLPTLATSFSFGGAGNLAGLGKNFDFTNPDDIEIEVTPDTANFTGLSTVSFPVTLNSGAPGRNLQATVFFDSNHTSPDFDGDLIEAYSDGPFSLFVPVPTADLDVEFFPPSVILGDPTMFADVQPGGAQEGVFTWQVRITNVGTDTLSDYVFTNAVPTGFLPYRAGSSPAADPGPLADQLMVWSSLPALTPGASTEIIVAIALAPGAGCNVGSPNQTRVHFGCVNGTELFNEAGPTIGFPVIDLVLEHRNSSYCELCREGTVELEVRNEGASDLYDLLITEELAGSGLQYVPGSGFVTFEGGTPIALEPTVSGTQLVWNSSNLGALINSLRPGEPHLFSDLNGTPSELILSFDLRSSSANPEDLLGASRQITASAQFDLFCGDPGLAPEVDNFTVPLRQPQPTVDKQGRNFSARQSDSQYSDPVFGGTDDVLVWRVDVQNSGITSSADLEDLLVNDTIGGNFTLRYICPSEAAATSMATALETAFLSSDPAPAPAFDCIVYTAALDVDDPFGNPGNDQPAASIDAAQGESAFIYYVGEIAALCTNHSNDADIEWGCEANPPPGGISVDLFPDDVVNSDDDDTALMSTEVDSGGVQIAQTVTGFNPAQPVLGTKGIITITITNNSGGTIRLGDPAGDLEDILPQDYELDPTWFAAHPNCTDRLTINTAYGSGYPGQVDTCMHVNDGDTDGLTEPQFTFTSSTTGAPSQFNLLRHGDQLVLQLGVVRVRPFDDVNHPEIREEDPTTTPPTDPDYPATGVNDISLVFDDTCGANPPLAGVPRTSNLSVNIDPEDIDVDINPTDPNLLYILSDPTATQALSVVVTNNGGHDATDYDTYVTVGKGIDPGTLPAGCSRIDGLDGSVDDNSVFPPELALLPPAFTPEDSRTYRCVTDDPLAPGVSNIFNFTVQRTVPLGTSGDLTFRADVLGESTLSDGSAPPDRGAAGYPYYSKDNILARIIGFNLRKNRLGDCSEENPPASAAVANRVLIGEECTFRIEAEWFGFATPGFGNIQIRNARIYEGQTGSNPPPVEADPAGTPNVPPALNGQGLVSIDTSASTAGIAVAEQNPPAPGSLAETGLAWRLQNIAPVLGNSEESFIADLRFRTLNDPVNSSAAPNQHGANRVDEVHARFDVFFTSSGQNFTFDENSDGYPPQSLRDEALRIIEPNVTLTKEVCNESVSIAVNPANSGASCTPFVSLPATLSGDSDDTFIYRLRATNEGGTPGGFQRAPAFDTAVDDVFDASDQIAPFDFTADSLDNDGDGLVDAADTDGEGTVDDTILVNGNPADISFSGSHSTALARINPGIAVTMLYRARLASSVTPAQQLTNTADGAYDSLTGAAGSQSAPQGTSGAPEGARVYAIPPVQATIEIDNIIVNPGSKEYIDTSRRNAGLVPGVCTAPCVDENAVIGEEVLVELEFTLPLSQLRQFSIEDNLPPGMECIEALDITLPTFPGTDPGFTPGGTFPATVCNATQVRWDLSTAGDQTLQGSGATMQYVVQAQFVARVRNIAANVDGAIIRNGGTTASGGTDVFVTYRDSSNTLVTIPIAEARLTVQEPNLLLTKTMTPVAPNTSVDAVDRFDVTIQIQNNGTSPAYNIQLLDTLDPNLSFVTGSIGGANPPDSVDLGVPATPRFVFNANNPLDVGNSFTFTYRAQVDSDVRPLEVLNNTIDARFTSLPGNTIALNNIGAIGTDGDVNGMRIGFLPPAAGTDPLNDYEAQATDSETVPGLTLVKSDRDPTVVPTIGARKHFQLVLGLPESIADAVVVNDALNSGDTSFVLENDGTFDITYTLQDIVSINGTPAAGLTTPAAVEAALVAFTALDEATGVVTWNFGTIVTANEDDASVNDVDPQIVIDYYARVANEPATVAGVGLQNAANVDFTDGETGSPAPTVNAPPVPPVTVVEPELEVDKEYLTDPLGIVIQGATAEFEIRVTNVGTSTAWDTTIVDMLPNRTDADLPGGMCANAPVITDIQITDSLGNSRALTAGTDYTASFAPPASAADLYCSYTIVLTPTDGANDAARIEADEILSITYETMLDVGTPGGSSLTNVAGATQWFSLDTNGVTVPPEIRQYDRTLTLRPDPNPGTVGIDDHQDAVTVQTQAPVIDVIKMVSAATASPGDTLHYTIVITNSGSVSASNVRVTDEPDELNILNFPDGYFENSPGTLRNILVNGVDFSLSPDNFSDPNGGSNGAGLLDIRNQTVPASGQLTVEFDIDVEGPDQPLPHAFIENIAHITLPGFNTRDSNVVQTEIINIATGFDFDKDSQDITGDPGVLVAGDTLRYTIRIENEGVDDPAIGLMHAVNVMFRDQVPAHTTYIANSTRLNGTPVPDAAPGVPPFVAGMLVNSQAPGTPAGFMIADRDPDDSNVATVAFDVTINSGLVNGTVISNHALLTGQEQSVDPPFAPLPFPAVVSDDPATVSVPDDPTQDTVGSGINIDALKTVAVISGGDAVADTGETLLYTIVVVNNGTSAATNVRLIDDLPPGTSFNPGTVRLNCTPDSAPGSCTAVPDSGVSPLITGIAISSDDLTPPLPTAGNGELSSGRMATIEFEVTITALSGTVIDNQGMVRANEQPDEPTDADGNDENGDQPTRVIVGGAAELEITKEVVVVGGGTAQPNGELEYRIRVENTGNVAADEIEVSDTMPGLTAIVPGSARIDGATDADAITFAGNTLTVDYDEFYNRLLAPGDSFTVTFRVSIDTGAQAGDAIDNTATVSWAGGSAADSANIDVGGAPGVINLNGRVWDNRNHDDGFDTGEPPLSGWRVRVYVNNDNPLAADTPLAETATDDQGLYSFTGFAPVDLSDADGAYTITFSVPDDPATFPPGSNIVMGDTISAFGNTGLMIINNLNVPAGRNAQNESLPVDPMGVVYNSITRRPVQGARLRLFVGNNPVSTACFTTPNRLDSQQGQITSALGFYRFDLNFSDSDCPPAGANFVIRVEMPTGTGAFLTNESDVIPPEVGTLDVAQCPDGPNDRVPSPPADTCEVQAQAVPPDPAIPPGLGTRYFPNVNLENGPEELFNNHLPVDADVGDILAITKQTPLKNVTRGQLVPYTITVTNNQDFPVGGLEIRDFFPPGFKYVTGSAVIDGQPVEPLADASTFNQESLRAGTLSWSGLSLQPDGVLTLKLLLVVGAGVGEGEYTNQAQAFVTGFAQPVSGRASATVRVVPDPTFDCSDVIGKVYDDRNANGYPDEGEPGIAGARIASARGLLSTTDKYGRFHITCAAVPNPDRGSNFILKLDERSLPSGYRITTENPRVQRLTRGKIAKFNFGVTLHRIVRLDLADQAFEFGGAAIQEHWSYVLDDLLAQLPAQPSILRITYLVENESEALAQQRLQAVRDTIAARWKELNCCYDLKIESEIFWRTGTPDS